jgi:ribosomal protein S27E
MSCNNAQTMYSSSLPSWLASVAVCRQCVSRSTGEAALVVPEEIQMIENTIGQGAGIATEFTGDNAPVFQRPVAHVPEVCVWCHREFTCYER